MTPESALHRTQNHEEIMPLQLPPPQPTQLNVLMIVMPNTRECLQIN